MQNGLQSTISILLSFKQAEQTQTEGSRKRRTNINNKKKSVFRSKLTLQRGFDISS